MRHPMRSNRALDVAVRRADPVAGREGAVEVDHQATEEVGEQVLGGEAHRDAADPAEGEHPRDAVAERLQGHQHRGDDHREAQELGDRVVGRPVVGLFAPVLLADEVGLRDAHEAHQEPRDERDERDVPERLHRGEDRGPGLGVDDLHREGEPDHPHHRPHRPAQRAEEALVPHRRGLDQRPLDAVEGALEEEGGEQGRKHDHEDLDDPGIEPDRAQVPGEGAGEVHRRPSEAAPQIDENGVEPPVLWRSRRRSMLLAASNPQSTKPRC